MISLLPSQKLFITYFLSPSFIILVADLQNQLLRKISLSGSVSTFAGILGTPSPYANGPPQNATFWYPRSIRYNGVTNQFVVADKNHQVIRIMSMQKMEKAKCLLFALILFSLQLLVLLPAILDMVIVTTMQLANVCKDGREQRVPRVSFSRTSLPPPLGNNFGI